jgi:hypothetical protein
VHWSLSKIPNHSFSGGGSIRRVESRQTFSEEKAVGKTFIDAKCEKYTCTNCQRAIVTVERNKARCELQYTLGQCCHPIEDPLAAFEA